jgi:hypothetical protein
MTLGGEQARAFLREAEAMSSPKPIYGVAAMKWLREKA